MPLYVMYGFDTAGSLAEETDDPRRKAPRAVLQALATAGTMGFLLILFGTMAVSDALFKNGTALNLPAITTDVLGSTWGKLFLADVAVAIFVCCLAIHAMSVRILFAMGRDDNLPGAKRLAHVSGTRRVPVFPAVLVGVIAIVVLAFNIYNQYAFEVIIALGIIFMYMAYLGVTIPLLQQRLNGWPGNLSTANIGLFKLGRWGVVTNSIAIFYGAAMTINLAWPRDYYYGTLWYQQYGPITGIAVVVIAGLALYYGRQQHHGTVIAEHRADMAVAAEGD
jgi:amino acid transporter